MIEFENTAHWNLPAMRKSYDNDGFVQGGKLLTDASVNILIEKIERYLEICRSNNAGNFERMGNDPDTTILQLTELWHEVDAVADIIRSPILAPILAALTGQGKFRLFLDQLQFKPAKIGGVNCWHQDVEFWPFKEPYTQITAWIALDDVDEENGCMRMVPGSHRWGTATPHLKALENYLPLDDRYLGNRVEVKSRCMPKGHVHFHHHLTWHGSGLNLTDMPRRALALHFVDREVIYDPRFGSMLLDLEPGRGLIGKAWPELGFGT